MACCNLETEESEATKAGFSGAESCLLLNVNVLKRMKATNSKIAIPRSRRTFFMMTSKEIVDLSLS
jgi:hypothetical protein